MADVHEPHIRSYNMSQIKGKDTKPELRVRSFLHANGFRYRLHDKNLPGTPDLVLKKYETVIFINGCFWHGHKDCKYFVVPKTRTDWWQNKINTTKLKDAHNHNALIQEGWKVLEIWECQLKPDKRKETLNRMIHALSNS